MPPGLHWPLVAMPAVLFYATAQPRPGPHAETDAQAVRLVILAAVAAIAAAHAAPMVVRHLGSHRPPPGPGTRRTVGVWDLGVRAEPLGHRRGHRRAVGHRLLPRQPDPEPGPRQRQPPPWPPCGPSTCCSPSCSSPRCCSRIYWLFAGNRWASWRSWMATTRARLQRASASRRPTTPSCGARHRPRSGTTHWPAPPTPRSTFSSRRR